MTGLHLSLFTPGTVSVMILSFLDLFKVEKLLHVHGFLLLLIWLLALW